MKNILFVLLISFVPLLAFTQVKQFQINAGYGKKTNTIVTITGYNERIPSVDVKVTAKFDQRKGTVTLTFGKSVTTPAYNCIWLPQYMVRYRELSNYFQNNGNILKNSQMFTNQMDLFNLMNSSTEIAIACENGFFGGVYNMRPKTNRKMDKQMIFLNGKRKMKIEIKVNNNSSVVVVHVKNPIPFIKKGKEYEIQYVGNDFDIVVNLNRSHCNQDSELIKTIKEYLDIFSIGETKLKEMQKTSRAMLEKSKELLLSQFKNIDIDRFNNTGCSEIQQNYEQLMDCIDRIEKINAKFNSGGGGGGGTSSGSGNTYETPCDTKKLNAEIVKTTDMLNDIFNDGSLAKDAALKKAKKDEFDAVVKNMDAKLNALSNSCRKKLDAKIIKNYEFVKKLFK